jgi:transcriptional regulator with XRE-family HTH domain
MQNYSNNLRELRKAKGMRQIEVAQLLGHLNSDRISDWETGKGMPSVVNLFKLSTIYGVTTEKLYQDLITLTAKEIEEKRTSGLSEWESRMKTTKMVETQ